MTNVSDKYYNQYDVLNNKYSTDTTASSNIENDNNENDNDEFLNDSSSELMHHRKKRKLKKSTPYISLYDDNNTSGEIACPNCTLLNPSNNKYCGLCDQRLAHLLPSNSKIKSKYLLKSKLNSISKSNKNFKHANINNNKLKSKIKMNNKMKFNSNSGVSNNNNNNNYQNNSAAHENDMTYVNKNEAHKNEAYVMCDYCSNQTPLLSLRLTCDYCGRWIQQKNNIKTLKNNGTDVNIKNNNDKK